MPANLNALIRYKTLDNCLSNPHRKWKIADLVDACSEALREKQGISSGVSERTIRQDIHDMRSDKLGFNAPIVQNWGSYKYSNPNYTLFGMSPRNQRLLERILEFILELNEDEKRPGLEEIIKDIKEELKPKTFEDTEPSHCDVQMSLDLREPDSTPEGLPKMAFKSTLSFQAFDWKDLLEVVGLGD